VVSTPAGQGEIFAADLAQACSVAKVAALANDSARNLHFGIHFVFCNVHRDLSQIACIPKLDRPVYSYHIPPIAQTVNEKAVLQGTSGRLAVGVERPLWEALRSFVRYCVDYLRAAF
jgi:hypothetical protein